jgi:hypothetical protein
VVVGLGLLRGVAGVLGHAQQQLVQVRGVRGADLDAERAAEVVGRAGEMQLRVLGGQGEARAAAHRQRFLVHRFVQRASGRALGRRRRHQQQAVGQLRRRQVAAGLGLGHRLGYRGGRRLGLQQGRRGDRGGQGQAEAGQQGEAGGATQHGGNPLRGKPTIKRHKCDSG